MLSLRSGLKSAGQGVPVNVASLVHKKPVSP